MQFKPSRTAVAGLALLVAGTGAYFALSPSGDVAKGPAVIQGTVERERIVPIPPPHVRSTKKPATNHQEATRDDSRPVIRTTKGTSPRPRLGRNDDRVTKKVARNGC